MNCPRDNMRLVTVHVNGYSLQKCPHCEGLWLAHNELDHILELGRRDIEAKIDAVEEEEAGYSEDGEAYMRCPNCVVGRLQRIHFTILRPVEIDRCDNCMGYWLDYGELDAILEEDTRLKAWDDQVQQQYAVAQKHERTLD